jgi:hypothetical protein
MSGYQQRISELQKREAELVNELSRLTARRKEFALAATAGDGRAIKTIADIDFEEQALRRDRATVGSALEAAEALARQEAQDEQAHLLSARRDEGSRCAEGIVTLNIEIDATLKLLREMFERHALLLRQLGNTELIDRALVMRMASKMPATSAAQFAGLGRYLNIEMVPASAQRALADSNTILLGLANSTPRVRPRQSKAVV